MSEFSVNKAYNNGGKMSIVIEKNELKKIIKTAIKEIIEEEKLENFLSLVLPVSAGEMKDIEKIYGKPDGHKKVVYTEEIDI